MTNTSKSCLVGINHIGLEVGDLNAAIEFYSNIFDFELRGRGEGRAFIHMGDQFLALFETNSQQSDQHRYFGLVVDKREQVRYRAEAAGAEILESDYLEFLDPWGNRIQVLEYSDFEFSKNDHGLKDRGIQRTEAG